jgi:hypothetical protein
MLNIQHLIQTGDDLANELSRIVRAQDRQKAAHVTKD